ncbi:MAG TPA: hypothetical protein PLQ78_00485 [Flavipsychrobacter sp.]|jgi:hypothetical protein|nr:hypothetical protein [Flavipsychrobacter sp.]
MDHFYFQGCPANDQFVAQPGNCLGLPANDFMHSAGCHDCAAGTIGTINYLGGDDWEVN